MEYGKTNRLEFTKTISLFFCLCIFFLSVCALQSTINKKNPFLDISCPLTTTADLSLHDKLQDLGNSMEKLKGKGKKKKEEASINSAKVRRLLSGPGSLPPRCTAKCGTCTPCKPVHVAVPPGTPVTAEYYPEAWRCKCGNKLYMP